MTVRMSLGTSLLPPRAHRRRETHLRTVVLAARPAAPAPSLAAARRRRAAVSLDRALYTCGCGYAWTDEVTTSVVCGHCGAEQAW